MTQRIRSIADDGQRKALLWFAARRAVDLAEEDFYHALTVDGLDDESLAVFARQAYDQYNAGYSFDYPRYAESTFLKAFALVYRSHLRDLANGARRSIAELTAEAESRIGAQAEGQ